MKFIPRRIVNETEKECTVLKQNSPRALLVTTLHPWGKKKPKQQTDSFTIDSPQDITEFIRQAGGTSEKRYLRKKKNSGQWEEGKMWDNVKQTQNFLPREGNFSALPSSELFLNVFIFMDHW